MSGTAPPEPPEAADGFVRLGPYPPASPALRMVVAVLAAEVLLAGVLLGWFRVRFGHGVGEYVLEALGRGPVTTVVVLLALLAVMVATAVVHELLHWTALRAFGYRPRVGVDWTRFGPQPYVVLLDQRWGRREDLVAALAPMLTSAAGLALALAGPPAWVLVGGVAFIVNTLAGGADLSTAVTLLRLPRGTEFYVRPGEDGEEGYAYVPADSDLDAVRDLLDGDG